MNKFTKIGALVVAVAATVVGTAALAFKVAKTDESSLYAEHPENIGLNFQPGADSVPEQEKPDYNKLTFQVPEEEKEEKPPVFIEDVSANIVPAEEPVPVEEPAPAPEPEVVEEEPAPVVEEASVEEAAPVEEEASVEEEAPAEEAPTEEPAPAEEAPAQEGPFRYFATATPAAEEAPEEEAPVEEAPAEEPAPAEPEVKTYEGKTIRIGNAIVSDDVQNGFIRLVSNTIGEPAEQLAVLVAPNTIPMVFLFSSPDVRTATTLSNVYFVNQEGKVSQPSESERDSVLAFGRSFVSDNTDFRTFLDRDR